MNRTQTGAKLIEFLQLAFLQVLPTHLPIADYVVKGGANMRLFYDSRDCQGCEYRSACVKSFGMTACTPKKPAPVAAEAHEAELEGLWD